MQDSQAFEMMRDSKRNEFPNHDSVHSFDC
jgi:hypothetical protein